MQNRWLRAGRGCIEGAATLSTIPTILHPRNTHPLHSQVFVHGLRQLPAGRGRLRVYSAERAKAAMSRLALGCIRNHKQYNASSIGSIGAAITWLPVQRGRSKEGLARVVMRALRSAETEKKTSSPPIHLHMETRPWL